MCDLDPFHFLLTEVGYVSPAGPGISVSAILHYGPEAAQAVLLMDRP